MPRKKHEDIDDDDDLEDEEDEEEEEEEEEEEDDEEDAATAARDHAMARLGGAIASLKAAQEAVVEALALFVNPDDDKKGKQRKELVDHALEAAGAASRGIEDASEAFDDIDWEAGEPWEDDAE